MYVCLAYEVFKCKSSTVSAPVSDVMQHYQQRTSGRAIKPASVEQMYCRIPLWAGGATSLTYMLSTKPTPPEVVENYANLYEISTSSCILKCAYQIIQTGISDFQLTHASFLASCKKGFTVSIKTKCMLMSQNFTLGRHHVCKINKTAYDKVLFFSPSHWTILLDKTWYSSETLQLKMQRNHKAVYNNNAVKEIKSKESNTASGCNTSVVHYLEKPSNSGVSRAFFSLGGEVEAPALARQ